MGVVGAVLALIYSSWGLLLFCLLSVVLSAMWYYCVRDRIPFAAQNLKLAATAVAQYPSTVLLAFFLTVLQVGWTLLWYLAVTGVAIIKDGNVSAMPRYLTTAIFTRSLGLMHHVPLLLQQSGNDDEDKLNPGVLFLLLVRSVPRFSPILHNLNPSEPSIVFAVFSGARWSSSISSSVLSPAR
jgi:hypothetical protein